MSFTSNCVCSNKKTILVEWQSPKSALLYQKKKNSENFLEKGGYWTSLKSFSLAQSISMGNSKSFFV